MPSEIYEVEFVARAFDFILELDEVPYSRTMTLLDLLSSNPRLGRVYEPKYEAMLPPIECRRIVASKTTVELFYYVDEANHTVKVIHVCDARSDPRSKFVGLHTAEL